MAYKYFLYSLIQLNFRKQTELKLGRKFKPGQVIVNGKKLPFTELSSTDKSRYSDAMVVAQGETSNMKYTMPGV